MAFGKTLVLNVQVGAGASAPTLTGTAIGSKSYTEDTGSKTFQTASAFNANGGVLSYSVETLTGVSINSSTGQVTVDTGATAVAVTTLTVTATNSEGSIGADFILTISAAAPPPTLTFADQDVVRGSLASIDAAEAFTYTGGGTLTYSLVSGTLPLGLTLNSSTGAISGTAVGFCERRSITIRAQDGFGYNQTATAKIGSVTNVGVAAFNNYANAPSVVDAPWNANPVFVAAVFGWTTETTANSSPELTSRIATARANTGTATAPRTHKITYTGPDIFGTFNAVTTTGVRDHGCIILIVADDWQQITKLHTRDICAMWEGFTIAAIEEDASAVLYKCRVGSRFKKDGTFELLDSAVSGNYDRGFVFDKCHFAGGENLLNIKRGKYAIVNTHMSHFAVDWFRTWGPSSGLASNINSRKYVVGCTGNNQRGWKDGAHPDLQHDAYQQDNLSQYYQNVLIHESAAYAAAGFRTENNHMMVAAKDNVIAVANWHMFPSRGNDWTIENLLSIPTPDHGSVGSGTTATFNDSTAVVTNFINVVGLSDSAIASQFPNVSGIRMTWERGSFVPSTFVPHRPNIPLTGRALRNYASTVWEPAAGWASRGLQDPAEWETANDPWPADPTNPSLTIAWTSGPTVSGTGVVGQLSGITAGGIIHFCLSPSDGPTRHSYVRFGCDSTSAIPNTFAQGGASTPTIGDSPNRNYGYLKVTASGSFSFNTGPCKNSLPFIHVYFENADGFVSNILSEAI